VPELYGTAITLIFKESASEDRKIF